MTLRQVTCDIIARLERETGYPAQVTALGSLGADPALRVARHPTATHHVLYNPLAEAAPDYIIAHQCGVALRLFANPPETRFELAPSDTGRSAVEREMTDPKGIVHRLRLTPEQTISLRDKLYGGLMFQLRATPVGLRVDRWLWDEFADLRDLQAAGARVQLREDLHLLDPEVRAVTPPRPLTASLAMNAAVAEFWSRTWDEPALVDPYRPPGSYRDGRALLRLWDMLPDEPAGDRGLVDAWAETLGIIDWYEWRPFPTPGAPAPAA
jgi:hypothetical protein